MAALRMVWALALLGGLVEGGPLPLPVHASSSDDSIVPNLLEDLNTIKSIDGLQDLEAASALKSLSALAKEFDTDKYMHNYVSFYPKYLDSRRTEVKNVVEVGVLTGKSLKMWRDYFPNAHVIGADIEDKSRFNGERIQTRMLNQEDRHQLQEIMKVPGGVDVFVDDGGHTMKQQLTTMSEALPKMKPGSIYILEDLQTSLSTYFSGKGYGQAEHPTALEVLEALRDGKAVSSKHVPNMDAVKNKIKSVEIWRDPKKPGSSITSVMILK